MAAPILWAPGIAWFLLLQNPHAHKIPRRREGGWVGFFLEKGGGCGSGAWPAWGFSELSTLLKSEIR